MIVCRVGECGLMVNFRIRGRKNRNELDGLR
jgi:hypothetical protein